ncbi:MAG: hypothetical protein IJ306_01610, partial [Oscillospiraceae bacterium]|nr:hypothetical protein [Oscillospiraceae bacterium]
MKKFAEKILSVFLAAIMIMGTGIKPVFAAESEEQSLEEIIRPQIEAFAKSIDQKDADGKAADALASHGITKNGKKLSVGENHALTATIMNSELFKTGLAYFCANIIKVTGLLQVDVMCETIECTWKSNKTDSHFGKKYIEDSGEFNSYDSSLVWMVGSAYVEINVELKENKNDTKLYFVTVSVKDRFDFSTDTESALKDILGFIGIMLFEPFDWESKASFQLEIPHTEFDCEHKSANYHWTLDTENFEFVSDSDNGFDYNQATREECVNAVVKGENLYCYNLDKYIRLNHNKPWVFEFTVKNMDSFMFSVLEDESVSFDSIYKYKRKLFAIRTYEREVLTEQQKKEFGVVNSSRYRYHYYGTSLEDNFYE